MLATGEFIRRFLIHVLPKGLHRIHHHGLFAKRSCAENVARARELLAVANLRASIPRPPSIPLRRVVHAVAHGISRQLQPTASGSTPHDCISFRQIVSSRSRALHRPWQNALRCPTGISNRPTAHHLRCDRCLIQEPLYHRPACGIGRIPIAHLICGTQIPIAPAAPHSVP